MDSFFILLNANVCGGIIEPKVIALAKDAGKTFYSVRIEKMKPEHLALLLVTNVLGAEIQSGNHHIYRGILGIIGQDMLSAWSSAQKVMLERGYVTDDGVAKDNQWIHEQIKGAG